jgi:hypothetical protein
VSSFFLDPAAYVLLAADPAKRDEAFRCWEVTLQLLVECGESAEFFAPRELAESVHLPLAPLYADPDYRDLALIVLGALTRGDATYEYGMCGREVVLRSAATAYPELGISDDIQMLFGDFLGWARISECPTSAMGSFFSAVALEEVVVEIYSEPAVQRGYPVATSFELAALKLGVMPTPMRTRLTVYNDTSFAWEKSGHGATQYQRRVITELARRSKLVVRSGTTYQNPALGALPNLVRSTAEFSEVAFQVVDGSNVLRGVFATKATSAIEQKFVVMELGYVLASIT